LSEDRIKYRQLRNEQPFMGNTSADDSLPWFVKVVIAITLLILLIIIGIDIMAFAEAW
jgi:hypothetical protein